MQTLSPFKAGDTFSLSCTYRDENYAPKSIAGLIITSQIRTKFDMVLVATLQCVPANQTTNLGEFVLIPVDADTSNWMVGECVCDVKVKNGSTTISSESFIVPVIQEVTE